MPASKRLVVPSSNFTLELPLRREPAILKIIKGIDTDSYHDIPEVGGTVPSNVAYNLGCEVPGNTVTARVMDYNFNIGFDEQYASGMLRLDPGPLQQYSNFDIILTIFY